MYRVEVRIKNQNGEGIAAFNVFHDKEVSDPARAGVAVRTADFWGVVAEAIVKKVPGDRCPHYYADPQDRCVYPAGHDGPHAFEYTGEIPQGESRGRVDT